MEKAQILSALKANIGTTDNRFDVTISKFIDRKNLTSVADAELNLEQYTDDLKWMYEQATGMANHEIANARKEWEKATPPTPQPKPVEQPPVPTIDANIQSMLDEQKRQIEELANQMKANQQKAAVDAIKASILDRGKALKANEKLWEIAVSQTAIADGATVESIEAAVKPAYEALQKSVFGNVEAPYGKVETDPDSGVSSSVDAFFKNKGFGKSE